MSDEVNYKPTIKDFLVYLVKKGILPKQAVNLCRQRKQEALEKGYSIGVKDILLEQGYIADELEYQRLWTEMQESYRLQNKTVEKSDIIDSSFSLSEHILQELISDEEFKRERHPDVPTDVILTVFNRWKSDKSKGIKSIIKSSTEPKQAALQKWTQRIHTTGRYIPLIWKNRDHILAGLCIIGFLWSLLLIFQQYDIFPKKYQVQSIQFQIPALVEKDKILEGTIRQLRWEEFNKPRLGRSSK